MREREREREKPGGLTREVKIPLHCVHTTPDAQCVCRTRHSRATAVWNVQSGMEMMMRSADFEATADLHLNARLEILGATSSVGDVGTPTPKYTGWLTAAFTVKCHWHTQTFRQDTGAAKLVEEYTNTRWRTYTFIRGPRPRLDDNSSEERFELPWQLFRMEEHRRMPPPQAWGSQLRCLFLG